jgi:flagellar basal-body rod protein FlgB
MAGKLDDYLRFNETALSLRAQRQQVLASNIANADTPNYKARDVDGRTGNIENIGQGHDDYPG